MEGWSFGFCYNDSCVGGGGLIKRQQACLLAKASLPLIGVLFVAKGNNLSLGFGENSIERYVSRAKVRQNGNDGVGRRSFLLNDMKHKKETHWRLKLSL